METGRKIYGYASETCRKMKIARFALAAAPCALTALFANGQEAQAPFVIDEAEALAIDARLYASEYGVSYDEALQRLTIMIYGSEVASAEAAEDGSDLAGLFYDNSSAEFGLSVATRKQAKAERTKFFRPKTKVDYGQINAAQKKQRNAERKAARQAAKLNDAEVEKAETKLSKPVSVKVKYKTGQKYAFFDLESASKAVAAQSASIPGFVLVSVDEAGNSLRLMVTSELPPNLLRNVEILAGVPIVVEITPGGFVPSASMPGGSILFTLPSGSSAGVLTDKSPRGCMTAFGARSNTLKDLAGKPVTGMLTAGHCSESSLSMFVLADDGKIKAITTPTGHSRMNFNTGLGTGASTTDLRFVYASGGDPIGLGTFRYDETGNLRSVSSVASILATSSAGGTPTQIAGSLQGSYLCHRGQRWPKSVDNMQTCGEVFSKQVMLSYVNGASTYTGGGMIGVRNTASGKGTIAPANGSGTLRCYKGDSGGPWFLGSTAYGVMSGCVHKDNVVDSEHPLYAIYTSLSYASDAGASVIVP